MRTTMENDAEKLGLHLNLRRSWRIGPVAKTDLVLAGDLGLLA